VSATKGTGLDQLLETLALQSEILELKADPKRLAQAVVLEARLDKGRGPVATVLVQTGSLKRGDVIVVGTHSGRVRAMEDENGDRLEEAGPSTPVQVIGLSGVPDAGELLNAVENERAAKEIIEHRESQRREAPSEAPAARTLDELFAAVEGEGAKELALVVKADVQGSVEALRDALVKLATDDVKVNVIHSGVGAVSETDVMLAKASGAIIVAFHVRPDPAGRKAAESQGVEIRTYRIIYEVTDDVKQAMVGLLPPTISEAFLGRAEVRQTFTVPKVGTIAGCHVGEGMFRRNASVRLLRDGVVVYEGKVGSLRRFKDDVREVQLFDEFDGLLQDPSDRDRLGTRRGQTQQRRLPTILPADLRNGQIEAIAQSLGDRADHPALLLERPRTVDADLDHRGPDDHGVAASAVTAWRPLRSQC
jgi:translation initiation factor IF-2